MVTVEGAFPKVGNDPLYASEVNQFNNQSLKQSVSSIPYDVGKNYEIHDSSNQILGFGINGGSGVDVTQQFALNVHALVLNWRFMPTVVSGTGSTVFTSDSFLTNNTFTSIQPYVDFDVVTEYDEINDSSVDHTLWTSGGTVSEDGTSMTLAASSILYTSGPIPSTVSNIYMSADINADGGGGVATTRLFMSGDSGKEVIFAIAGNASASNVRSFFDIAFNHDQTVVTTTKVGQIRNNGGDFFFANIPNRADISAAGNNLRFGIEVGDTSSQSFLHWFRWKDRGASYASTGTIEVTHDDSTYASVANGESLVATGSRVGIKAIYNVTGSEIIQQKAWGVNWV